MGRGSFGSCRLELSLVLDTQHRLGTWGYQTARLAVPDVDLLGLLGLSRLWSRAYFCFGTDIDPSGKAGSGSRRLRKHDLVHDPRSTGPRSGYHQLRALLPAVTSVGSLFPLELLLADCRSRFHGNGRDGAYPTTKCSHRDYQPDACQSLRKPRL